MKPKIKKLAPPIKGSTLRDDRYWETRHNFYRDNSTYKISYHVIEPIKQ
jgi:hypothetical protein